ncbi:G patch domain-containing protein 4 [Bulinus truncatus]|nr:G patch domain-containing protein 4 [Bulinus truncatus]
MLKNQGWKEGSGLGKQEDGRAEPIKVALKKDKRGVGHNLGEEFTDHWWLRVFNEAAQKIGGKKEGDIEREKVEKKSVQNALYKGFVKSSTLTDGVETSVRDSESDEDEKIDTEVPTLDDIYKFCGGATGHRAAMFGIKMKGKLSRVAKQDSHFEETLKKDISHPDDNPVQTETENNHQVEKKKKRKNSMNTAVLQSFDSYDLVENGADEVHKKKKRKKKKDNEDISPNKDSFNNFVKEESVQAKQKRKKSTEKESCDTQETEVNADSCVSKKKKKKEKYKQEQEEISIIENSTYKKRKKRKKKRHLAEEISFEECISKKTKNKDD